MTDALAALHDWMEEHPFLTHLFGPMVGALIALVIVPLPWLLMTKGVPAVGLPALPQISLQGLLTVTFIAGYLTLFVQWLMVNQDRAPTALFPSERGWIRAGGSFIAFLLWSFTGGIAASLSARLN